MADLIINKSYEGWKILSREPQTVKGRVYYSCRCLRCKETFRVAGDNIASKLSKRCRTCAGAQRRKMNKNMKARDNPQLYALWWRLGGAQDTGWKEAADFIQWAKAIPWKHGQRIVRISARKAHGPSNSRFENPVRAITKHIQTIAVATGQSVEAVEQWAKGVTIRYVTTRAKSLSTPQRKR